MNNYRGKIGRLSADLREQLNQRLADGETGDPLLEWLNALPAVRDMLCREFAGHPITQQNLSNWRVGGYQHWLQRQERHQLIQQLAQDIQTDGVALSHLGSTRLIVELRLATVPATAGTSQTSEKPARNHAKFPRIQVNPADTSISLPPRFWPSPGNA